MLKQVKVFFGGIYQSWFKIPVHNEAVVRRGDHLMWWSGLCSVVAFGQLALAYWFEWASIIGAFVCFMLSALNELLSISYRNLAVSNYVMTSIDLEDDVVAEGDEHESAGI